MDLIVLLKPCFHVNYFKILTYISHIIHLKYEYFAIMYDIYYKFFFLPNRLCTKPSNCIIYKYVYALKVSEEILYILNIIFLK